MDNFLATGSDHFQILLDQQMKANGSESGNVGRIVFRLENKGDLESIIGKQLSKDISLDIYRLSYKRRWLTGPPYWVSGPSTETCDLELISIKEKELINGFPIPDFNTAEGCLYKTYLIDQFGDQYFMLAWHHVLFDARGAEHFARFLCGETETLTREDCFSEFAKKPVLEALEDARITKDFLLTDRGMTVDSLATKQGAQKSKIKYELLQFTEEETKQIATTAGKHVRLAKSPYYLACCAQSVYQILSERNKSNDQSFDSFLIPVPQDQRLRGSVKPVFGNTLSYLFFRIKPEQLTDLKTTAESVAKQMMDQIRKKIPVKYSSMLNLFSRLPLWLNNKIMSGPTKGVVASFFFSDTGDSFSNLDPESKVQIQDVFHLPPPNKYPGLTLVFSIFKKKLKVCICSTNKVMEKTEYENFKATLSNLLLNGKT